MSHATEAAPREFKAGDLVNLRSGGPYMTVVDVGRETGQVWCRWADQSGTIRETALTPAVLRHCPSAK
jgi:uncharacterized protein YodC (DUF2158 family)